jgi:hypothetical protein
MQRFKKSVRVGAAVLLAGCVADSSTPLAPEGGPSQVISDAAHAGAVPGFYFLPPMVPQPAYSGTFDAGVQPRVEVCELSGSSCGATIAQWTMTSGVTVSASAEQYQVNWHTSQFDLDPAKHYRISVFVGAFRLGYADVDVVASGKDLKNVDTQQFVALLDGRTLPIKFRIETGIVAAVVVSPDSADIAIGGTQQFTATLIDLHGNPMTGPTVAWASSDEDVATIDPTGLATGVAPGAATITATAQAASGTAILTVFNPNQPPVAEPDTFSAIGNFTVPVSAPGVLANDTDPDANPLQAVAGTFPTANGGTFTLNADGSFTYLSAAGFTGEDEVGYEITDGLATASSMVTFVVPTRVWYVANDGTAPGDGRDASPFTELKLAEAASLAGETIFVLAGDGSSNGLDEGIVLKDAQSLTGQGVPANVTASLNGETVVLLAAGSAPQLTRGDAGATVALAQDNTVQGMDVASTAGAGIAGAGFGTLTAGSVSVSAAGGPSLDLSSGTAAAAFAELSSAGSAGAGLRLVNVGGLLSAPTGSIVGAAGTGIEVSGGNAAVTYGGNVASVGPRPVSVAGRTGGTLTLSGTIASTGQGILVQGNGGGTIAFTGASKSLSTGVNHGVELVSNTGAAVQFAGGGLAVATTTGEAFRASGGGTVTVTGVGNTLTAVGGAALRVANTTIGAAGITFRSVAATGGANGIVLENTGSLNGMQVTGTGVAGSGGTIQGTSEDGVYLESTRSISLAWMEIRDNLANGIAGTSVSGFALDNASVLDNGDDASADEGGIRFYNLSGSASVSGTTVAGSVKDNVRVANTSGVLDRLTVSGSTFAANQLVTGRARAARLRRGHGRPEPDARRKPVHRIAYQPAAGEPRGRSAVGCPDLGEHLREYPPGDRSGSWRCGAGEHRGQPHPHLHCVRERHSRRSRIGSRGSRGDRRGDVHHRVRIAGNTFADVWRQGVLVSSRDQTDNLNVAIRDNVIGTVANPVGRSNRRGVEIEAQAGSTMRVEVGNNPSIVVSSSSGSNSALHLRSIGTSSMIHATVTGNLIGNTNLVPLAGRFRAETLAGTAAEMCLDLRDNSLDDGTRLFELAASSAGPFRVAGPGTAVVTAADITAANTVGTGSVAGAATFNGGANCLQPVL